MNYNTLIYEMVQTMQKAENCTSRQEAIDLLNRATRLREAAAEARSNDGYKYGPTTDHLHQKVGGSFGSDDYSERWH